MRCVVRGGSGGGGVLSVGGSANVTHKAHVTREAHRQGKTNAYKEHTSCTYTSTTTHGMHGKHRTQHSAHQPLRLLFASTAAALIPWSAPCFCVPARSQDILTTTPKQTGHCIISHSIAQHSTAQHTKARVPGRPVDPVARSTGPVDSVTKRIKKRSCLSAEHGDSGHAPAYQPKQYAAHLELNLLLLLFTQLCCELVGGLRKCVCARGI